MFDVDWELEGRKKIKVGISLSENLLGSSYMKQTPFLGLTCYWLILVIEISQHSSEEISTIPLNNFKYMVYRDEN